MPDENIRLSVSKYKTFSDCKKKFHFAYILKLPRKEATYHIVGKFVHKVLEDFHQHYLGGINSSDPFHKIMGQSFKTALSIYKPKMTQEMVDECWEMINGYLKLVSEKGLSNILAVEKEFEFPLTDKVGLIGMIDRVQIDSDGVLHLADYKSTKNKKYLKNDWLQLLTYAYVILQDNPDLEKIRVSYILLRHNFEYITTEFDVAQIKAVKEQYIQYAQDILGEKEFPANPTALCNFCDFQSQCVEGRTKGFGKGIYGEIDW
jgi:RecB family exonuclease